MAQPFKFTITDIKTAGSETVAGAIEEEEWSKLADYLECSYRLAACEFAKTSFQLKFGFSWQRGEPVRFNATLPPERDIAEFLHRMRPFVLEREPTAFQRVRNIVARHLTVPLAQRHLDGLRRRFAVEDIGFTIKVGDLVLTAPEAVRKWLNAFEYHRDTDKQTELRAMYQVFPESSARVLFLVVLLEQAAAIGRLGALLDSLVKRDGTERRVRQ